MEFVASLERWAAHSGEFSGGSLFRRWFMENAAALSVDEFLVNCSAIESRLDEVGARDGPVLIATVVVLAQQEYRSLLERRELLPTAQRNAPLIQFMLDSLRARLKFLEKFA
jgi:hypothetical protein